MTRQYLTTLAAGGSAALLLGAMWFQFGMGLYPCELCLWQRWPHVAAVLIGIVAIKLPLRAILWLGALAAFASAAIGAFHVGVEQGWWEGLARCGGGAGLGDLSLEALMDPTTPVASGPKCTDIAWSMFGISMAGWNAIASLGLSAIWAKAALKT